MTPWAAAAPPDEPPAPPGRVRELGAAALVAVIFALFVRTFLVQAFVVPSASMEKTVLVGDHLLVNKFVYASHQPWLSGLLPYREARRGDVIVFKFPEDPTRDFIKRVVALPGDLLEIRGSVVSVNGAAESALDRRSRPGASDEEVGSRVSRSRSDRLGPVRIAPGGFFAMGDNRGSSYDSRFWGPVPAKNLKGRALFVYWSLDPGASRPFTDPVRWIINIARATRWSRTFFPVR